MRTAHFAAALILVAGAAVVFQRSRQGESPEADAQEEIAFDDFSESFEAAASEAAAIIDNLTGGTMRLSNMKTVTGGDISNPNVQAFLRVIRRGEGTGDDAGYRRIFGGALFTSYAAHPNIKVSKSGYVSTAAGAFQFLKSTWDETAAAMNLRDFSPTSQERGAVGRIAARGALEDVKAGRFESAIRKCAKEWASLPFSPYGQPTISLSTAAAVFAASGGTVNA